MSPHKRLASTSFRWAGMFSGVCAICLLLTWGFLHWWISRHAIADIDQAITDLADVFSTLPTQRLNQEFQQFLERDLRRVHLIGLFAEDGSRLGGNVETLPFGLVASEFARERVMIRVDPLGREEKGSARYCPSTCRWIEAGRRSQHRRSKASGKCGR